MMELVAGNLNVVCLPFSIYAIECNLKRVAGRWLFFARASDRILFYAFQKTAYGLGTVTLIEFEAALSTPEASTLFT
jgi:hypothetical protein